MRKSPLQLLMVLIGITMLLTYSAPARASHIPFAIGDVFVGVGFSGTVQHRSPLGVSLENLTTSPATGESTGMAFDSSGKLYSTNFGPSEVSVFNTTGGLIGTFGSGYSCHPESIVFNLTGYAYVGQADCSADILLFSPSGTLLDSFDAATTSRGTDWIDLDPNQCTMYYTSEGSTMKRYDVCTDTQMTDFATGLNGSHAYAHRLLPDGTHLVADTEQILRLNSTGGIMQVYGYDPSALFFALNLDPDGIHFWTADYLGGDVFKINIETEIVALSLDAGVTPVSGLAVFGELTGGTGFVIPELPIGTILAALLPLAALIIYTRRQSIPFR